MQSIPAASAAVLVVKNTFLELVDEEPTTPRPRAARRRAATESSLLLPVELKRYSPGCLADSAALPKKEVRKSDEAASDEAELGLSEAETASATLVNRESALSSESSDASSAASSRGSSPSPAQDRPGRDPAVVHPWTRRSAAKVAVSPADQKTSANVEVDSRTTVMLRNMPNNYTRAMLLSMLDEEGFKGLYDFVYLPVDFARHAGLGYAFINLTDPATAARFWRTFDGYNRWVIPTSKVSSVSWSEPLQGLEANVERYRNSPVMHSTVPEEYRPVLYRKGQRVPFPKPTKAIRSPLGRC